jgi:hypothetical protein
VAAVLAFYLPLLLGLRTFPAGDFTEHFFPFSLFHAESLRAWQLPQWIPNTFAGQPWLADTQAAPFYPISSALLALTLPLRDAAARLYLLQVEAILQTILAGLFMAVFVHALTGVRWAALLAGLTLALSGYLTAYPPLQLAVLRTAIWLPLILWLLLEGWRAVASGARALPAAWAMGAGVALAVAFLAGHPQTFLYIGYTTVAWVILLAGVGARANRQAALRFVGAALLAALVATGLSMAQLLPSLEFTRYSVRATADYAFAGGGFPLRDTWQLLLPGILTQYSPLYVGLPALALAVMAAVAAARPQALRAPAAVPLKAVTWFLLGLALFALLVSYGANGPIFGAVYRLLPGWGLFRGQERAAFLVALALSTLAGVGAAALATLEPRLRRRLALLFGAVVVGSVYGVGLLMQVPGRTAVGNGAFLLVALEALLLASATALILWLPGRDGQRPVLLLALTLIGLFAANFGSNFDRTRLAEQVAQPPEVVALQQAMGAPADGAPADGAPADGAPADGAPADGELPGRVYNEYRVYEDYSIRAGVEDLWGSSPLRLATYAPFAQEFPLDRWWSLTGVTHVLTWRRELFVPSTLLGEFPQESDTTYLHELALPSLRAWMTTGVVIADGSEAIGLLADHSFPLTSTVVLPPEAGVAAREAEVSAQPATVRLSRTAPEVIAVEVSSGGGILYLSENWMPGWRVAWKGDGAPAAAPTLLRANHSFLGVPVPPGDVALELRYAPSSLRNGLWVSSATLLLVAAGALLLLRMGRRQP